MYDDRNNYNLSSKGKPLHDKPLIGNSNSSLSNFENSFQIMSKYTINIRDDINSNRKKL